MKKISKRIALCLVLSMLLAAVPKTWNVKAATASAVTISGEESTEVLIIGKSYSLNADGVTSYQSSNPAVTTVAADGTVTLKKTGSVVITAVLKNNKKVSQKYYVVNKACATAYQKTLTKMLEASNVNKMVIKNLKTEQQYVLAKGNYEEKKLYVNAPESTVRNYATFQNISIVDAGEKGWSEYGSGNSFIITDDQAAFQVMGQAKVKEIELAAKEQKAEITVNGSVECIRTTGEDSAVTLHIDGEVGKVVADANAKITIDGTADSVLVERSENAKETTITSDVSIQEICTGTKNETTQGATDYVFPVQIKALQSVDAVFTENEKTFTYQITPDMLTGIGELLTASGERQAKQIVTVKDNTGEELEAYLIAGITAEGETYFNLQKSTSSIVYTLFLKDANTIMVECSGQVDLTSEVYFVAVY